MLRFITIATAMISLSAVLLLIELSGVTTMTMAHAKMAPPNESVPLDRLLKNVDEFVRDKPRHPEGHYVLGRLHGLAFARGMNIELSLYGRSPLPSFPGSLQYRRDPKALRPNEKEEEHLRESLRHYWQAVQLANRERIGSPAIGGLEAREALYLLGLSWVLEQAVTYNLEISMPPLFDSTNAMSSKERWLLALDTYRQAYELARREESISQGNTYHTRGAISVEAGEGIIRLLKTNRVSTSDEQAEIKRITKDITKTIEAIKRRPIVVSPIIFPLKGSPPLRRLLTAGKRVTFDLVGDGVRRRWPWVSSDTGILVWDPERTGRITSGRQLFGSVTWWLFWRDGYAALGALDDNRDGWLCDGELTGIAVWRDRNANAVSEPGEVQSLAASGIVGIATVSNLINGVPANPKGIRMRDGSQRPTYDWTPTSEPLPRGAKRGPSRLR